MKELLVTLLVGALVLAAIVIVIVIVGGLFALLASCPGWVIAIPGGLALSYIAGRAVLHRY